MPATGCARNKCQVIDHICLRLVLALLSAPLCPKSSVAVAKLFTTGSPPIQATPYPNSITKQTTRDPRKTKLPTVRCQYFWLGSAPLRTTRPIGSSNAHRNRNSHNEPSMPPRELDR